jgi:hypothetical protein
MTRGGKREGAGRPKGSYSKEKKDLYAILEDMDCRPEELLAKICNGEPIRCRQSVGDGENDFVDADVLPTFNQRMNAAKELMQYTHAKLKAIEHSGELNLHEVMLDELE